MNGMGESETRKAKGKWHKRRANATTTGCLKRKGYRWRERGRDGWDVTTMRMGEEDSGLGLLLSQPHYTLRGAHCLAQRSNQMWR